MAYSDAISNAIAARGNALAQAAQQQGQVYGNLSANLGQLPFQAMQAGQRRRALEVETQQRELQTQTIQDELNFQKEMSAAISGPGTPEEIDRRAELVLRKRPEKWLRYQELVGRRKQQEFGNAVALNAAREGKPGTMTPIEAGMEAELPLPTRGQTTPYSLGNAFEPAVPLEAQRVHPTLMTPSGQPLNARTDVQVRRQEDEKAQAAAEIMQKRQQELQRSGIEGQKEVASFTAGLRTNKPLNMSDLEGYVENMAQEHQRMTGQEATPGQRATWLREIMLARAQAGVQGSPSQFLGFDKEGKPVAYVPSKKGTGGTLGPVDPTSVPSGPITSKTETFEEARAVNNAKSGLRAAATVRDILKDKNVLLQASIPGSPGQRKFNAARKEMVDVLTRLRTGAALNTDEETFYTGQAPTLLDLTDPDAIEYKLKMFEDLYSGIANRRTGGGAAPPTPTGGAGADSLRKKYNY